MYINLKILFPCLFYMQKTTNYIIDIKFIIFDFDGVFTDGKCYFDSKKNIKKYYNIKDGMAMKLLRDNNIKTGLISSYVNKKEIYLNENKINEEIIEHLKFDYIYIGENKKINILNNWLSELNLDYNNVAYIGDDINDIEIMKLIKFSACPSDAIDKCKEIVNYVCNKNGGNGCVREFVDLIINNLQSITIVDEIKKEFNYQIDNFNLEEINNLCEIIKLIKGNIYFCGVGKSGNIAKHCCDLLKCISYSSFYLDILNSTHGDIGTLTNKDIILMFSNSGNTNEIINIIPLFKNIGIKTVGICCNKKSKFKELCDITIITPFKNEISGEIDKIPTNSYMSHLIFSNILVSLLKKNITLDKYKENHLAGNIGKNLSKVKDVLIKEYPKIIMNGNMELNKILLEMTEYKIGCCFFVDDEDNLLGILTDGDIRRLLINNNFEYININNINRNYYYVDDLEKYIFEINNYNYVPIIDKNKIIGIYALCKI
jgi:arabinose-5-phosphate isomerase